MGSHDTFKIFVGNLSPTVKDSDIHEIFSRHGKIVEAVVMTGKNYGFVHMASEMQGLNAMQKLEGFVLHGQRILLRGANPNDMNLQRATARREPSIKRTTTAVVGQCVSNLDNFEENLPGSQKSSACQDQTNDKLSNNQVNSQQSISAKKKLIGQNVNNLDGFENSNKETNNKSSVSQPDLLNQSMTPGSISSTSNLSNNSSERPSPLLMMSNVPHSYTPDLLFQDSKIDNFNHLFINQEPEEKEFNCGICDEKYDQQIHTPKILSCNHTFCLDCLSSLSKGAQIKCPKNCPYDTILHVSGVTGLTTNQTKIPVNLNSLADYMQPPFEHHIQKQSFMEEDVCVVCLCTPPSSLCLLHKHELIKESKAFEILRPKLKTLIEDSFTTLRSVMTVKANLKERMEYTLHSLTKFSEELKIKIRGEEFEQKMHQARLQELNDCNVSLLNSNSLNDLLAMCQQVEKFSRHISSQHALCYAKDAINGALDSILLKLNDSALENCLSNLGFSKEEPFSLSSSLRENAEKRNFANVILIYLLCDLLSLRYRPSIRGMSAPINPRTQSVGNNQPIHQEVPAQMIDRDVFDINNVLETTEAIEAARPKPPPPVSNGQEERVNSPIVSAALSLGLSNISFLPPPREKTPEKEEEPEAAPVSYVSAAKKPAKPAAPKPVASTSAPSVNNKLAIKFPHCWMTISINGRLAGRIVFQLRPDMAPKMCDNFIGLCTGRSGYGYKGTRFFKSGDGFLVGGDVENNDGTGGYSVFNRVKFEADLCPLKDDVGMVRFKGIGTTDHGRGMVGSQFMIWFNEREFKRFSFSLVFGRVVDGLNLVQEVASHNLHNVCVKVEKCGAI